MIPLFCGLRPARGGRKVAPYLGKGFLVIGDGLAHLFDAGRDAPWAQWKAGLKKFIQSWVVNTLSVLVAVYLVKGIRCETTLDLLVASLLLGILNTFLRPILIFFALPLVLVTLGLFMLAINAVVLYFVGYLLKPHFYAVDFSSAFWGALVISLVGMVLNSLTGTGSSRIRIERGKGNRDSGKDGDGPVIDV